MKRSMVVGAVAILAIFLISAAGAHAAPEAAISGRVGPYEGTFEGYAYGDRSSKAPIMLDLTHRGDQVEGMVSIGEGLVVSGGFCDTSRCLPQPNTLRDRRFAGIQNVWRSVSLVAHCYPLRRSAGLGPTHGVQTCFFDRKALQCQLE